MSSISETARQCRAQLTAPGAPFEVVEIELTGRLTKVYRHAFAHLPALLHAARAHGDKPFMVYEGVTWSFTRFFAAADALGARLQSQLGIRPGDRVALAMRNQPEWAVGFVALGLIGAVPAPLNSFGLRDELLDALRTVQPRLLICDAARLAHVADDLPALDCLAMVVDLSPNQRGAALDFNAFLAAGAPALSAAEPAPDDPALILFTSGASSQAKAVPSTQRALCQALFNIDYIGTHAAMCSPQAVAALMARGLAPTTLTAVPLFHVSGLHAQLLAALRSGRRLVLMHRWDPARALALIAEQRITQFNGAPAMVMQLLAQPGFDDPALTASLGGLGFGGAGMPQRLIDDVLTRRPDSMSGIGFGLTETNGVGAAASGTLFSAQPRSAGQLSPIVELRIADLDGSALPVDQDGEIWLRGVTVMQGYWRQPGATAQAMAGEGWFRSGDIGRLDAQGHLFIVDRIKDVINRNGEKIAAAEIESCLLQHPQVLEAAVFGRPDETTGEAVVAVVVGDGKPLDGEAIRAHVAQRLAAYKVPMDVHVRHQPLPRNPAGKLIKSGLKREYLAR
jgi:long-chain acyl-CoA synthetase